MNGEASNTGAGEEPGQDPPETEEWRWISVLPDEDIPELILDVYRGARDSTRQGSAEPLETVLDEWRETARVLSDPLAREALLSKDDEGDWTEVARPSGDAAD